MTIRTNRRPPKARRKRGIAPAIAMMSIVPLGIIGAIGLGIARVNTVEMHAACNISEKEDRALASLDKREPRVYTDCGVFVVADEPFRFHFGAADVYNKLQAGETVDLTTVGWRFGLFSWFPNVVDVEVTP